MNSLNVVVRERELQLVTLQEAAELYGLPHKYLVRWKRDGTLTDLSGLVIQRGRAMIDRQIFERIFHLVPIRRRKAPKAHRNGVGHLN